MCGFPFEGGTNMSLCLDPIFPWVMSHQTALLANTGAGVGSQSSGHEPRGGGMLTKASVDFSQARIELGGRGDVKVSGEWWRLVELRVCPELFVWSEHLRNFHSVIFLWGQQKQEHGTTSRVPGFSRLQRPGWNPALTLTLLMDAWSQELELNEILIWLRFRSKATLKFWFCFRSVVLEKGRGVMRSG